MKTPAKDSIPESEGMSITLVVLIVVLITNPFIIFRRKI